MLSLQQLLAWQAATVRRQQGGGGGHCHHCQHCQHCHLPGLNSAGCCSASSPSASTPPILPAAPGGLTSTYCQSCPMATFQGLLLTKAQLLQSSIHVGEQLVGVEGESGQVDDDDSQADVFFRKCQRGPVMG